MNSIESPPTRAQCNYVIEIEHGSGALTDYLYTGDLWSSAPDGLKSHDIQYWGAIQR